MKAAQSAGARSQGPEAFCWVRAGAGERLLVLAKGGAGVVMYISGGWACNHAHALSTRVLRLSLRLCMCIQYAVEY